MNKIIVIFGTRPEAIKLCPLVFELKKHSDRYKPIVCVTAQHRQMLDQVLNIFELIPDYDFNLMTDDQSLFEITSKALAETDKIIRMEKPDLIVVQGDTTTTFAVSLAAFYNGTKVGHVEAGLRTWNKYSPFPEEMNRRLTGVLADLHFAPTERNKENLLSEGVAEENILVTGNTVVDAILWVKNRIESKEAKFKELENIILSKKIILVTGHRRENFGKGLANVCCALKDIAKKYNDLEIIYPLHLNPNVRNPVKKLLSGVENIKLINPLSYEAFVFLMDRSYFIISDSGGIQEEAPSLGKPVLVTRNTTERPEAVEVGAVKLVGTCKERIIDEAERLLTDLDHYAKMSKTKNPYGDGKACKRIVAGLDRFLLGVGQMGTSKI